MSEELKEKVTPLSANAAMRIAASFSEAEAGGTACTALRESPVITASRTTTGDQWLPWSTDLWCSQADPLPGISHGACFTLGGDEAPTG